MDFYWVQIKASPKNKFYKKRIPSKKKGSIISGVG